MATATKKSHKKSAKTKPANALKSKTQVATRKTYIEVMRIIAAFLVIVNHTNSTVFLNRTPDAVWFFSISYFFVSKIAVPVFFMIMGGLLLQKIDTPKRSVERLVRILIVTFVFSVIYYIYLNHNTPGEFGVVDFFKTIITDRATNAFWYLYTYIGLLIVLPLLQRMANAFSQRALGYFVLISMVFMGIVPLLNIFFKITLNTYTTSMLFEPYLGIVFAGLYIERYVKPTRKLSLICGAIFVVLTTIQVLLTYNFYKENPSSYLKLDNRTSLFITASAICFYIIVKYLGSVTKSKKSTSKFVCYLGSLTFGIYLISDLVIKMTKPTYLNLMQENTIFVTIVWEVLVFVICAVITGILKTIPGIKKLL